MNSPPAEELQSANERYYEKGGVVESDEAVVAMASQAVQRCQIWVARAQSHYLQLVGSHQGETTVDLDHFDVAAGISMDAIEHLRLLMPMLGNVHDMKDVYSMLAVQALNLGHLATVGHLLQSHQQIDLELSPSSSNDPWSQFKSAVDGPVNQYYDTAAQWLSNGSWNNGLERVHTARLALLDRHLRHYGLEWPQQKVAARNQWMVEIAFGLQIIRHT